MITFGVDPGTVVTGYGVIIVEGNSYRLLDCGCVRPPANIKLSDRYLILYNSIEQLLDRFKPDAVAVEAQYVHKNPQSAIKLGMARGMVILAARKRNIPIKEYYPSQAKLAVVGNGKASKNQVQGMVQKLLGVALPLEPYDVSDALSLAICHVHAEQSFKNIGIEL